MTGLSDVLADETVNSTVPQPDGSTLVWAEASGPAPNAVEVFADHTTEYEVEEREAERSDEQAYCITPT